jgi:hypothetical protein
MIMVTVFRCGGRAADCCQQNQDQERDHGHCDRDEGVARVHVEGEPPGRGEPERGYDAYQSEGSPTPVTENLLKTQG